VTTSCPALDPGAGRYLQLVDRAGACPDVDRPTACASRALAGCHPAPRQQLRRWLVPVIAAAPSSASRKRSRPAMMRACTSAAPRRSWPPSREPRRSARDLRKLGAHFDSSRACPPTLVCVASSSCCRALEHRCGFAQALFVRLVRSEQRLHGLQARLVDAHAGVDRAELALQRAPVRRVDAVDHVAALPPSAAAPPARSPAPTPACAAPGARSAAARSGPAHAASRRRDGARPSRT
jgi:hypothetical protein